MNEKILKRAKGLEKEIIKYRRYLHQHAEVGFDLVNTLDYVESTLKEMGYDYCFPALHQNQQRRSAALV